MPHNNSTTAALFRGPGEMRSLARDLDWSNTPLGAVEAWSLSLRATVKTLLASQYPMVLTWGSEFTQIYNDAYAKFIGDRHPDALGNDIRVTLAESWDVLGPMIDEVMRTGVANWTPSLLLRLERSGYPEETYFSVSHAPVENDADDIVGMLAVCSEVTQQILGERRTRLLREIGTQEGEIRSVEETCSDVLSAIEQHGLDVPFAAIYLWDQSRASLELQGAVGLGTSADVLPPSLPGAETAGCWPLWRAAAGEKITIDDVGRDVAVTAGPWNEPVENAIALPIAGSVKDLPLGVIIAGVSPNRALDEGYSSFLELLAAQVATAIRNARAYEEERARADALARLDQAKTAFFSNVSHEFRTPLTLLLGPLEELIDRASALDDSVRAQLATAHRNALRLLRLVNTLLDFARIEAGRAQASYRPIDLAQRTADLASNFRSACEHAGLQLVVECMPLPEPVYVDEEMWEKIVLNLLSNAFKYTHKGEIRVMLQRRDAAVELLVSDTGVGIPDAELPLIFERFHRVEAAEGRSFEGTGIGLALVQELVGLHGGSIGVESVRGQGTTFTVRIPTGRAHLPADRVEASSTLPSSRTRAEAYIAEAEHWLPVSAGAADETLSTHSGAKRRLLLADDNADMRLYVKRLLEAQYDVTSVADGAAAVAAAQTDPPDLVLLDVMMPGLDGIGAIRALRSDPKTEPLPIILLSARAGEEARVDGLAAGADDYFVKPFNARELLVRIESAIRLAHMRAEAEGVRRELHVKETMLSEINHRVKNNLQFISSLITFTTKEVVDPFARDRLGILKQRVMHLGAIHNLLYDKDTAAIEAGIFVPALCRQVQDAFGMDGIAFSIDVEPLELEPDRTIPLGLLINEALLNCFKHAFGNTDDPRIDISLRLEGKNAKLAVADNGDGAGQDRPGSSGMQLMRAFAAQLGGHLAVEQMRGTRVEITFPATRH